MGTLTFFLSLLIVVRHLGLVWKMKLATVVLALVLFVSQASAELEPVLLAVQEKATYKSKVVNETLLPYAIEALIEEKEKNKSNEEKKDKGRNQKKEDYYPRYKQNHYEDGEKEQEEDEKKEQEDKKKNKKKKTRRKKTRRRREKKTRR